MNREDRWWATYNAGLVATEFGRVETRHESAVQAAELAHGPLDAREPARVDLHLLLLQVRQAVTGHNPNTLTDTVVDGVVETAVLNRVLRCFEIPEVEG